MSETLAALLIPLSLLCTWLLARWILGPLDQAGKANLGRTQFWIIDFFCLMVEIQVVVALTMHWMPNSDESWPRTVFMLFGVVSASALWLAGVRTLSRAGILHPRRRLVFNWVVLPMASVGSLALVPVWGALIMTLAFDDSGRPVPKGLIAAALLLTLGILASKPLANWVVAEAQPAPPLPPPQN